MLSDIDNPESRMLIEACGSLDKLRKSYPNMLDLREADLKQFYGNNRVALGRLAMIAEKLLTKHNSSKAEQAIMLLYKPLTGQINVNEHDFPKIESLIEELESEHFFCGCI